MRGAAAPQHPHAVQVRSVTSARPEPSLDAVLSLPPQQRPLRKTRTLEETDFIFLKIPVYLSPRSTECITSLQASHRAGCYQCRSSPAMDGFIHPQMKNPLKKASGYTSIPLSRFIPRSSFSSPPPLCNCFFCRVPVPALRERPTERIGEGGNSDSPGPDLGFPFLAPRPPPLTANTPPPPPPFKAQASD